MFVCLFACLLCCRLLETELIGACSLTAEILACIQRRFFLACSPSHSRETMQLPIQMASGAKKTDCKNRLQQVTLKSHTRTHTHTHTHTHAHTPYGHCKHTVLPPVRRPITVTVCFQCFHQSAGPARCGETFLFIDLRAGKMHEDRLLTGIKTI